MKFVSKSNDKKSSSARSNWIIIISVLITTTTTKAIFFVCAVILLVTSRTSAQLRGIVPVVSRDRDAVALKNVYEPNSDGSYVYR